MNPKKLIIGVVITIVLIAVGYFIYKKFIKPTPEPESDTDNQGKPITWTVDEFPLKQGSKGNRVKQLQAGLNILKNANLDIDGKFGTKTMAELKEHFNLEQLTESAYNTYIKPNINKIDEYIASKHPANKPKPNSGSGSGSSSNLFSVNNSTDFIGKSVVASGDFKGYLAKKDDDKFVIDEHKPVEYTDGQYIGIAQVDNNGWLQCIRANGSRVFVLKSKVKKFNS